MTTNDSKLLEKVLSKYHIREGTTVVFMDNHTIVTAKDILKEMESEARAEERAKFNLEDSLNVEMIKTDAVKEYIKSSETVKKIKQAERQRCIEAAKKFTWKIDFGREIEPEEMAEISGWMNQIIEQHNKFLDKILGETSSKEDSAKLSEKVE